MGSKRWATVSALPRISNCAASAALPQTNTISEWGDRGTDDHKAIEAAFTGAEVIHTSGGPISVPDLQIPAGAESEIAFSWDAVTGVAKNIGRLSGHRAYPDTPYSTICGSADVWAPTEVEIDGERVLVAFVCDWKTGSVLPESSSWQLRALAMAAAKTIGARYAVTRITQVRDGRVYHKPQRLWMPEELAETEVLLRKMYDRVNHLARAGVSISDVTVSSECHFCPAFRSCPANKAMLQTPPRIFDIDQTDLGQAARTWNQLRSLTKQLESTLRAAAQDEPISMGNGEYLGHQKRGFMVFKK